MESNAFVFWSTVGRIAVWTMVICGVIVLAFAVGVSHERDRQLRLRFEAARRAIDRSRIKVVDSRTMTVGHDPNWSKYLNGTNGRARSGKVEW